MATAPNSPQPTSLDGILAVELGKAENRSVGNSAACSSDAGATADALRMALVEALAQISFDDAFGLPVVYWMTHSKLEAVV